MNKRTNPILLTALFIAVMAAMQSHATAQQVLLNEVEIDPPSTISNGCQYAEVLAGNPGGTLPSNIYFLSVNSDAGNFGFANQAINIGGQVVGANGTITLNNTASGGCPNRVYPTGTTVLNYSSPLNIGQGSETYLIVQSKTTLFSGQDLDTNDDGLFESALGITVLDGFALLVNPEEEYVYGAASGVVNISNTTSTDQPDAVTRLAGNTTPFAANAFYYGELVGSPDETTEYAGPFSPNFPPGGVLTPGALNNGGTPARTLFDYDGDGKADISVFRPGSSTWYLLNSSNGTLTVTPFGLSTDRITPADYDGDGKTDVAVFRDGTWYIQRSQLGFTAVQFGASGDAPVSGDYDGDGKADLAVFRQGVWYILNSGNSQLRAEQFGTATDKPVVGDFDGDDKNDLAVFRDGTWYLQQSQLGFAAIQFGIAGDKAVAADYDGDGKTDVAVFRNGTWYIQRSQLGFTAVQFGAASDRPVPADYDGDGKADIAVFRDGTWYQLHSLSNSFSVTQFGQTGDAPTPAAFLP